MEILWVWKFASLLLKIISWKRFVKKIIMPLKLMLTIVLGGGLSTSSLFRDKCEGRGSFMTEMFSDRNVFSFEQVVVL